MGEKFKRILCILLASMMILSISKLEVLKVYASDASVIIDIDMQEIKTLLKAKKTGTNLEMSLISDKMWAENGKWMEETFVASDVPILRWGYDAWVFDWENEVPLHPDKYWGGNNSKDAAGSFGLYEFVDLCVNNDIIPFVDIPIESHDFNNPSVGPVTLERVKELTRSMAQYLNNQGIQNAYFDMGNEPWCEGSNKYGEIPAKYYGNLFKEFQAIIKSVNPNYKLVLQHAPEGWVKWNNEAEQYAAGYFDAYDDHQYYFIDWNNYYDKNDDNFFSSGKVINGVESLMGECNLGWTNKTWPHQWDDGHVRDLGGALALLNAFLDIINKDSYDQILTWPSHYPSNDSVDVETLNPFGWFNLDEWDINNETSRITGPMIAHMIVNQNILNKNVKATSNNNKIRTFAYTNEDNSVLKVILINKLWQDNLNVNINLPQGYSHVNAMVMKGDRSVNSPVWDSNPVYVNHLAGNTAVVGTSFIDDIPYGECAVVYTFYNDNSTSVPTNFSLKSTTSSAIGVSTAKTFQWTPAEGATNYHLTASLNSDLSSPVIEVDTGIINKYQTMIDLEHDTTYYWSVEAQNKIDSVGALNNGISFTTAKSRNIINDNDSSMIYTGTWNDQISKGCFHNDDHSSNTEGSYVEFSFNGTQTKIFGIKDFWCGKLDIEVDGGAITTVDTYSPDAINQEQFYDTGVLSNGVHTIKLTVRGDNNPNSEGYWIEFDKIEIN